MAIFLYANSDIMRKFLTAMTKVRLVIICWFFGIIFHVIILNWTTDNLDLGIAGIGYASSMSNFIVLLLMLIITLRDLEIRDAIFLPDKRTFQGLWTQIGVGFPMLLMICMDQWIFEIMIFNAGMFGVVD